MSRITRSIATLVLACSIAGTGAGLASPALASHTSATPTSASPTSVNPAANLTSTFPGSNGRVNSVAPSAIHPDSILSGLRSEVDFTDQASAKAWLVETLGYTALANRHFENFTFVEMYGQRTPEGTQWVLRFNFAMEVPGEEFMKSRVLDLTYAPDGARTACIPGPSIAGNDRLAQEQPMTFARATGLFNECRTGNGWDTSVAIDSIVLRTDSSPYSRFDHPQMYFMVEDDPTSVIAVDTVTGHVMRIGDQRT
jgi:hypothetical protein